jgi:aspartate/methionine/tyrosine aminotransferase
MIMKITNPSFPRVKIRPSIKQLQYSPTLEINEYMRNAREQGLHILNMGFGESPFPVHPEIQTALAAHADKNMYLPAAGLPELRSLARDFFAAEFGFEPQSFDAVIGPGSKELIFELQLAVAGDLLLPIPAWVSYAPQAKLIGDHVIRMPTLLENNLNISADQLEQAIITAKAQGLNPKKLILNYPNNPTGLTISPDQLTQIAQVCRAFDILVISDEIYGLVNHKTNHVSLAKYYPEGTVVVSGLSKHISLGGYRLGVALIPAELSDVYQSVVRIASETWSTVSAPIQYAARRAFGGDSEIRSYIQTCTRIHGLVSGYVRDTLVAMGVPYPDLQGAFYLFPNFNLFRDGLQRDQIETSPKLAKRLIDEHQIGTLPGTAFGDAPENLTLRLACCGYDGESALAYFYSHPDCSSDEFVRGCCPNIELACEKLKTFFAKY